VSGSYDWEAQVAIAGGVYRSDDAGESWTRRTAAGLYPEADNSFDVKFDPNNSLKAVAHFRTIDSTGHSHQQALYSLDGGVTWTAASSPVAFSQGSQRIEFAYAKAIPSWIYAMTGETGMIYRSTDGGVTWAAQGGDLGESQLWYNNTLWVDPTDAYRLVAGAQRLYRSTNGGATLTLISDGQVELGSPHLDNHCIVPDPQYDGVSNRTVWVCTDGGIFRTSDIMTAAPHSGWSNRNSGFVTTQYYHASGHPASGWLAGGLQDNGVLIQQVGSPAASMVSGADGGVTLFDPTDGLVFYSETQHLTNLFRFRLQQHTADYIGEGIADMGAGIWIPPLALSPSNPSMLLVGSHHLWRTTNARTGSPPQWQSIATSSDGAYSAIAVSPTSSDVVWLIDTWWSIYKSENATAVTPSWTLIHDLWEPAFPNLGNLLDLTIDPRNHNHVYVTEGSYIGGRVWRTTDGGLSWSNAAGIGAGALPAAPVRALAVHPERSDWLYAGTEVGVFASYDSGESWTTSSQGPRNVAIDELSFLQGSTTLLATTHGRGLWTIDLPDDTHLLAGLPAAGQITSSEPQGVWRYYYVDIGEGDHDLSVLLDNLSGDLDLYVRHGELPNLSEWNCRPHLGGTNPEQCTVQFPQEGRWWVGVLNAATGTHSFQITADWESGLLWDDFETGGLGRWSSRFP